MKSIVAAAIRVPGLVLTLPKPNRHDDILRSLPTLGWSTLELRKYGRMEQGFLDSEGVFCTRTEAYQVAAAAGQVPLSAIGTKLYSEDVW